MKIGLLALALVGFSLHAAADDKFDKMKQETISHIDKQIEAMNSLKSCISSAQDKDAFKKCHEANREQRMGRREEMLEKRKSKIDERIKKLEEEKAKLQSTEKSEKK
jgi:hypothetical protein